MKLALIIILSIAVLFAMASLGAGYYMYRFAILRRRGGKNCWEEDINIPTEYSEEIQRAIAEGERYLKAQPLERVNITSFDGLTLSAHVIDREAPNAVVVLSHGYRSNPVIDFGCVIETYIKMNFAILIIDQRAHGYSEGNKIGFGATERFDIVRWTEYARDRWKGLDTVLDGVSMGSATVMMGGTADYPENVRAVIADCGYTSPGAICRKVLKQWFSLPPFPIYYSAKLFVRLLAHYDLDGVSSAEGLRKMRERGINVLIAHGRSDDFVPYEMSLENIRALDEWDGCELFTVDEADHAMSFILKREEYMQAIYRLFDKSGINYKSKK